MDRSGEDGSESPRIDVNALPDSLVRLWDAMLRIDPTWDLSTWLEERADEELELVESHLGRERLRLEQRLHRIETLVKRLKRQREVAGQDLLSDPHQKNLFDVFDKSSSSTDSDDEPIESDEPVIAGGIMGVEDDPLLAIVAEHILGTIEVASLEDAGPVHFDDITDGLQPMGISVDEVDEAIAHLLQHRQIVEIEQDFFGLNP
ncbi:MAG: hypothetical protein VYB30_00845 [Candidatus Thermoplasmatota archaeon]|nr:hypothetical protein [Candidatus Thermoplasmatota archaeon]